MEHAVRRFARNILLAHLALLAVVMAVVVLASRAIENSAREQALRQAQRRQELLATQTARGIEQFYQAILNDLDLVPRDDEVYVDMQPFLRSLPPPPQPKKGTRQVRAPLTARGTILGVLLARQLSDRISHLFVVDRDKLVPRDVVTQPAPGEGPAPETIVARYKDWLKRIDTQSVSRFELFETPDGATHGLNLVGLPVGKGTSVVVAAVPVANIAEKFLDALNADADTGAFLVDDSMTAMAASRPGLTGANLVKADDPQVRETFESYARADFRGSRTMSNAFKLGQEAFVPAVVTAEPIQVVPGRRWFVLVASPLSDVDRVVGKLFDRITLWAICVSAAVTGILVSSAVWLIRSRVRMERVRHEVLKKELDRAREIQQSWLPRESPACGSLDVAAVNFPANHISGDFYNWFELPDGRTVVAIGDVTGHGMSAAFLMATTQMLVRTTMQMRGVTDPGRCLEEVNRQLCSQVYSGQFVTMQVIVFDPDQCRAEVATAGHPPPLISSAGEPRPGYRPLAIEPQLVLGVEEDAAYESVALDLSAGDTMLLLYTDGVADTEAPDGSRLGNGGLLKSLPARRGDARGLLDTVLGAVNRFRGRRPLCDDVTLVAIRYAAPSPVGASAQLAGAAS